MRLNGQTVAQAAGLDLTDETINGVYISNNADRFGGPKGGVWTDTYSSGGALLSRRDPLAETIGFQYDASLNATAVTDPPASSGSGW